MKPKFLLITTVPQSLNFFKGQLQVLKSKFDIEVASSPGERLESFKENEKVKVHPIVIKREISLFSDIKSLFKLYLLITKINPVIVHGNTPKGGLLSMLASYFNNTPIRIYFLHGLRYEGTNGMKRKFLKVMESIACSCATHIFSVSYGVKQTAIKDTLTNKEISIIGNGSINGIDTQLFNPDNISLPKIEGFDTENVSIIFGYVGRLVGDKGTNELINAFCKVHEENPTIRLLIVGLFEEIQDPVTFDTKEKIKTHPGIVHVGYQKDVKPFLKLMDVFVFPSYREGFGIVLMEAAAMRTPAIASNISGCNEIVKSGHNGLLIAPRKTQEVINGLQFFIQNPDKIKEMGAQARAFIQAKYEQKQVWANSLDAYVSIYHDFQSKK
ncbi:glycosyltransferase family 4 protein [Galbibacter sp. BG1]|uniref:glycosyltransferase family 4 protein n=1 Tax=Galbibacter sp. BG1 TaxID=1170699 RepID=UPI0015B98883|nr:glycosyltransferase family 4 protein [Galbibacter sp. BG1]QLE02802.1 glycosyltransferase family 4 protein [Galbibacter sp. BG1]